MGAHVTRKAVKILVPDGNVRLDEHLTHFFNNVSLPEFRKLSDNEKNEVYELLTKHKNILIKVFGQGLLKSNVFFPEMLKNGVENEDVINYKLWVDKQ